MKNNIINILIKNISSGFIFGLGIILSLLSLYAFESLTSNPSDSGNQSLSSPMLSKIGGIFDRDTMSLEAIANGMVNRKDCETKYETLSSSTAQSVTLSCSAGYTLVDHSCIAANTRGASSSSVWADTKCYLSGNDSLYLRHQQYRTNARRNGQASIKCCKYLVP